MATMHHGCAGPRAGSQSTGVHRIKGEVESGSEGKALIERERAWRLARLGEGNQFAAAQATASPTADCESPLGQSPVPG